MDLSGAFPLWIYTFIILWITSSTNASYPNRLATNFISGTDPGFISGAVPSLMLSNATLCTNVSEQIEYNFKRLIIHDNILYVGGTNRILQINLPAFTLDQFTDVGPVDDDESCVAPSICKVDCTDKRCTDNPNRLLIPHRDQLIVCGTVYHGTCDILTLKNISQPYRPKPDFKLLKCAGEETPQIGMSGGPSTIASVFVSSDSPEKDLFYVGSQKEEAVTVLFPPRKLPGQTDENNKLTLKFTEIVKTKYAGLGDRNYIASWTTSNHSFIIWTTPEKVTKLARLCHSTLNELSEADLSDENYGQTSYTETILKCGNLTFATSVYRSDEALYLMMSNKMGKRNSLCSTNLTLINNHFNDVRESCLKGETTKAKTGGGDEDARQCGIPRYTKEYVTCGLQQKFTTFLKPIISLVNLSLHHEFLWPNGKPAPTTFAVDSIDGHKVAFFGMKDGKILKAQIGRGGNKFSESITLEEGSPVLSDVAFDQSTSHLYAMTANKVYQIKVSNCVQYDTCEKCVGSGDPYCGWCVLQSRCATKQECGGSAQIERWMNTDLDATQCPRIASVQPNSLSIAYPQVLTLKFGGNTVPQFNYTCDFSVGGKGIERSRLEGYPNSPSCRSPQNPPPVPDGQDHLDILLEIKASDSVVASGMFSIYDCTKTPQTNRDKMCGTCVTSSWNCEWCTTSNTCSDNCTDTTGIRNQTECPYVIEVLNANTSIPVGKYHEFTLLTRNLPTSAEYQCMIKVCDAASEVTITAQASRTGDNISCPITSDQLACEKEDSDMVVTLKSGDYQVDTANFDTVRVGLFNCTSARSECGTCIISHNRHPECSWCQSQDICIPAEDCIEGGNTEIENCPAPRITEVTPLTGPQDGGTEITIKGTNLATTYEEIINVFIKDELSGKEVNCTVIPEKYIASNRIVCETERSKESLQGKVHLTTAYSAADAISAEEFVFKKVNVSTFNPEFALKGTKVTVIGENLDVGNGASMKLSGVEENTTQCLIRTPESLVCIVPIISQPGNYHMSIMIDGFSRQMKDKINYVEDPQLESLVGRTQLISFFKGGLEAKFKLSSILGIQTAVLSVNDGEKEQDCQIDGDKNVIVCPIPPLDTVDPHTKNRNKRSDDSPVHPGFSVPAKIVINDAIEYPVAGGLSYVVDPVINPISTFPCRVQESSVTSRNFALDNGNNLTLPVFSDDEGEPEVTLQLAGKHLDSAAVLKDYSITIVPTEFASSPVPCIPRFLDKGSLICKSLMSDMRSFEGYRVKVTVQVGNLTFPVETEYCPGGGGFSNAVIGGIIAVVVLLVLIIIILICVQRRRARKQQKEREQIMLMLDTLENRTRENARKAYFELQLGYMTTLTDNISDSITYLPPVSCFMRTLFNSWNPDHPMLAAKKIEGVPNIKLYGLDDFVLLLKNKEFLITLVKTLEDQKHFTVKEKGHFASLLTVCLFDDMAYFTRVMMELLSELIQRHVGKNPKLLLRRSESVVEKMVSHWLCVTLYSPCIIEQAGKPLFLLTKAIHFLVNSAPSDVVANKAVNSLNEMTLLGSEVTYEVMTLKASVMLGEKRTENFDVKVVNCDTITQVKEKIIEVYYADRPYSECPKPDKMALEFHVGGQGNLTLSDIDSMSHKEGNYTRINTLSHYNVPDGAEIILLPLKEGQVVQTAEAGSPPPEPKKKRLYHLIHPRDKEPNGFVEDDDGGKRTTAIIGNLINQPFQEIYLTRMVKSKTTVQEYVDGVFNAILNPSPISRSVKYLFQFLDKEAVKHKIGDPEVLHIWKNNSLLLRYWVNILKNPEFLFDVNKTAIVDSCLNVITQAFMDACTTTNHKLGQDSPSNKLLYAKDAEKYKEMVAKFFVNVSNEDAVTDEEIDEILLDVSKSYAKEFNKRAAALELFNYLDKYRTQVLEAVENDALFSRLNETIRKISPDTNGHSHETSILI